MVNGDPCEPDDYDGYVDYITGRSRGLCKPFIKIRKEATGWRWTCSQCPPNPRTKKSCGGLHRHVRFSRPFEKPVWRRCLNAALRHLKLEHT